MWDSTGIRVIPMCLEMSSGGHGDIREPFIELVRENGVRSSDFKYASYTITDSRTPLRTLPCAYSENGKIEHLCLTLTDGDLVLELHYCVFPDCDVITRSAVLKFQQSKKLSRDGIAGPMTLKAQVSLLTTYPSPSFPRHSGLMPYLSRQA